MITLHVCFLFYILKKLCAVCVSSFHFLANVVWWSLAAAWGSSALEQASQRGCASSILRGIQELAGESPEQPGLTKELPLL